ncbi:MAG: PadR family transcriptional regulator [archaeon]|nr:PadR family transcriptional regulator [archaeon]
MSGHDIILEIHEKLNILIRPNTVYSLLESLKNEGLVTGCIGRDKIGIYTTTDKGREFLGKSLNDIEKGGSLFSGGREY